MLNIRTYQAPIVAAALALTVLFAAGSSAADKVVSFAGLDKASHLYGPKITAEDLKGKVVFLEYWGINCPPCRASFPHLVHKQAVYAKTGKFTVLASHVQGLSDKVKEFCKQQKANFPVFQQFNVDAAPCGNGIPSAALIDHTGKVVAQGHPDTLYKLIDELVKNTPTPPPAIIGDVKVKYCKAYVRKLASSGALKASMEKLEKLSAEDSDKGREAKALLEAAGAYLSKQKDRLVSMSESRPAEALKGLTCLAKRMKGMESAAEILPLIQKLKEDKSVNALCRILTGLEKIRNKIMRKGRSASTQKKIAKIKRNLEKLLKGKNTSELVAAEAKDTLELL